MWNARYENTQTKAFLIYLPISSLFSSISSSFLFHFHLLLLIFIEWTSFLIWQLDKNTFGISWSVIQVYIVIIRNVTHILALSKICMHSRFDVLLLFNSWYCIVFLWPYENTFNKQLKETFILLLISEFHSLVTCIGAVHRGLNVSPRKHIHLKVTGI